MINAIANPTMPEKGERYLGTVVKITDVRRVRLAAARARTACCTSPSCARSPAAQRVENVEDVVSVGQKIQVEITEIDDRGKLSLVPVIEETVPTPESPTPDSPHRCPARPHGRRRATAGRRSARIGAARRAAGRHREDPGQPAPSARRVVGRRLAARDAGPARRVALPGALLFKGTPTRSAEEISAAIDAVGGDLNAYTAKEHTCFYARVLDRDADLALDVLTDMITNSLIRPTTWSPSAR